MTKSRFEDKLTEKIYDNIHGFIALTREEKRLLNTSYFQRLNLIKQLSLSCFVFPGAVHTRFAHSLGVLHIAEKMIQKLKLEGCDFFNDCKNHQITRLAALLHDIGHYPLSHTVEKSYMELFYSNNIPNKELPNKGENKQSLPSTLKEACQSSDIQHFLAYVLKIEYSEFHHETFAKYILKSTPFVSLFKKLFPNLQENDLDIISSLIEGKPFNSEYYIASDIINSKLDADQMDYMKRDTINTGIQASVDIDFIIHNMTCCEVTDKKETKLKRIAFKEEALQAIEQFLLAKYYWYSNIIYYDKSYIINCIAQRIYSKLLFEGKINQEYSSVDNFKKLLEDNPDKFFFFNDNYFWQQIQNITNSGKKSDLIYKLSHMLINRKFPEIKNQAFFDEHFKNNKLINTHCQITDNTDYEKAKEVFQNKINELNSQGFYLHGASIRREIASPGIYIITPDKQCKDIIDMPNQFFKQFISNQNAENATFEDKDKNKELKVFRIYDFKNILNLD